MHFSFVGKSSRLLQLVIARARSSISFLFRIIFFNAITKPWSFTFTLIDIYTYIIFSNSLFFPFHFNFFPFLTSPFLFFFCPLLERLQVLAYYYIFVLWLYPFIQHHPFRRISMLIISPLSEIYSSLNCYRTK